MSGQLGELVISLSADMARFQSDMGKAVQTTQKAALDMSRAFEGVQGAFNKIGSTMAAITAGAGLKKLMDQAVSWNLEAAKMAKTMGATSEQASIMATALHSVGIGNDLAINAALKLSRTLSTGTDKFDQFGISVKGSNGALLPMPQIMANVNQKLLETKTGTDRNVMALSLYGKSWGEMQAILKLTPKAMEEAQETAQRLHLIVGPDGIAQAAAYKKNMREVGLVAESMAIQLGNELLPVVVSVGSAMATSGVTGASLFGASIKAAVRDTQEAAVYWSSLYDKWGAWNDTGGFLGHLFSSSKSNDYKQQMANITNAANGQMLDIAKVYDLGPRKSTDLGGAQIDIDATKRAREAAAAMAAAAAEADRMRNEFNKGVQSFNKLVETLNAGNPDISAFQKALAKVNEEVAQLGKEHPEQAADAMRVGEKIKDQLRLAEARKADNAAMAESIKLMEEMNKDWSLTGLSKGLSIDALKMPQIGGTMGKDGRTTGGMPKLSLTGASETSGLMGNPTSEAVTQAKAEAEQRKKIEDSLNRDLMASKTAFANDSLSLLQSSSKQGTAIAVAAAAAQKAIAVAQIIMNAYSAASAATQAPPIGLGPVGGAALAAETIAMGYTNAALAAAAGAIQIAGARAMGGAVNAGKTYLVGEKGPELMTTGANGYITPNHALGGNSVVINNSYDFSGADMGTIHRLRSEIKQNGERTKADILNSMNRGGEFAIASGRIR